MVREAEGSSQDCIDIVAVLRKECGAVRGRAYGADAVGNQADGVDDKAFVEKLTAHLNRFIAEDAPTFNDVPGAKAALAGLGAIVDKYSRGVPMDAPQAATSL